MKPWEQYQTQGKPWEQYQTIPEGQGVGDTVRDVARVPAQFLAGAQEEGAEIIGALPDLVAQGLRAIGVPAPEEGFYTQKIKEGLQALGSTIAEPIEEAGLGLGPRAPEGAIEEVAEAGGRGAAQAAGIFAPASVVARAPGLTGRVAGAMAAQPATQAVAGTVGAGVTEATDSPMVGTLAAMATPFAGAGARRLVAPIEDQLTREGRRLAGVAAEEGIDLTAAQRSGSRALQYLESVFGSLPFTASRQEAIRQGQQRAFNRAVLRRAGIYSDVATPDVLDDAAVRLGQEFERLSARTTVSLDRAFNRAIAKATARYGNKLPSQQRQVFRAFLDDLAPYADEGMPGGIYQQTRSDLTKLTKSIRGSDPALSNALRSVRDALDNAAGRSVPTAIKQDWKDVRRQYANLMTVQNVMDRTSKGIAQGDISPAQLQMGVRSGMTRGSFARGRGELNDLARVGKEFLQQQVPDSGTAQRNFYQTLLTLGGAGGGGMFAGGDPMAMVGGAIASLGGPVAAQRILNTGVVQRYLSGALTGQELARALGPRVTPEVLSAILAARVSGEGVPDLRER